MSAFMNAYRAESLSEIRATIAEVQEHLKAMPYSREQMASIWDLAEVTGRLNVLIENLRDG